MDHEKSIFISFRCEICFIIFSASNLTPPSLPSPRGVPSRRGEFERKEIEAGEKNSIRTSAISEKGQDDDDDDGEKKVFETEVMEMVSCKDI